jgi:hypothetical protein
MLRRIALKFGPTPTALPLEFDPLNVTVFVGPNNSGKSLVLREVDSYYGFRSPTPTGETSKILARLSPVFSEPKRVESDIEYIRVKNSHHDTNVTEGYFYVYWHSFGATISSIKDVTASAKNGWDLQSAGMPIDDSTDRSFMMNVASQFILKLDGATRLTLTGEQDLGDTLLPPTNLLAALFVDNPARERVRTLTHEAFQTHFVLDPTKSGKVRVRLSARAPVDDIEEEGNGQRTRDFHRQSLPINSASDGVRAYTGILASLISSTYRIILIDEPEAFLHPPLARRLGGVIAKLAGEREGTVFASTHSSHFLMGCIESGAKLNIVRLTYESAVPTARLLSHEKLLPLMRDPLLRSTGVLNALFSSAAVVCEADADRGFYEEINMRLATSNRSVEDAVFLNAQNKSTIRRIVRPLREAGVPAIALMDLDILKQDDLKLLMKDCFVPQALSDGWNSIKGQLAARYKETEVEMKKHGLDELDTDNRESGYGLLHNLRDYGIFVVPVGELERWLLPLGIVGKKTDWIMGMYERLGSDPTDPNYVSAGVGDVWEFISSMRKWVMDPNRKGMPAN